jgi:hypothetical protein
VLAEKTASEPMNRKGLLSVRELTLVFAVNYNREKENPEGVELQLAQDGA